MARLRQRAGAVLLGASVLVNLCTRAADAQDTTDAPAIRGPVEVGVTAGALHFFPTFGVRVTVPVHQNFALEGTGDFLPWMIEQHKQEFFLFQIQLRQTLRRGPRWRLHGTYGAAFFSVLSDREESREKRADGSVLVYPAYRRMRIGLPVGLVGFGGDRPTSNRAALRWDVQAVIPWPVGPGRWPGPILRATVGVSWHRGGR